MAILSLNSHATLVFVQQFDQAKLKLNIKAPHY